VQLVVGRIGRAHGVRGDVHVDVLTDDAERRYAPGSVLLTDPPERGPLTVRSSRPAGDRLVVHFDQTDDRDAARLLSGTLLLVDADSCPPLDDPDEYWDHQLVGLSVRTVDDEHLGTVADVLHPAGEDLLVVDRPDGGATLVPFVTQIVPTVDIAAGVVVVDPPPGLLEL
jgi:16S rRNA processing protein RimM